ncbi:baseplate hub subunit [Escherichia phage Ecwhy_1]|uniref:Baseplate hub subunit n=1 Tax=Escherichia phage fEgEco12 TaxID=3158837 RepID=A0AAU7PGY9_9CAUD|nr:baseplate hub subunit [Escherichia phage Ecwhy_1]
MAMNPLAKYTKIEELGTKLVTNGVIPYKEGVLGSKGIKCGICARSARDEMTLNTPDMLLNGDAIARVIENCVPNVLDADELYVNDVEQLLIAIKVASKEESYDINVTCPECNKEGRFERSLSYLLETAQTFSEVPTVQLDNGLSLEFRPLTWKEYSNFAERMFTEQQKTKFLETAEMEQEEKVKVFGEVFESMAQLNFDMIAGVIAKVITPEGDEVTENEFIAEWLGQQSKGTLKIIREKMDEVLEIGVSHTMEVECSDCNHQWEINGLKYDPSHFFA